MSLKVARKARGFSIVELLIWIAVVGVLATFMFPAVKRLFRMVSDMKARSAIQNWKTKIGAFYIDTGKYPKSLSDLAQRPVDPKLAANWRGPYTEDENEEAPDSLYYANPPEMLKDLYKNYELYSTEGLSENEDVTRDMIRNHDGA